uniref:Calpain catalytic domain-containing protein n=1 Tax=Macrostomum lignano TaxID=282301 RepID=A0A1I8I6V0_9PLAT
IRLFHLHAAKATGAEPAEVLVSPDGLIYGFRPWEHIYSIGKLGKSPNIPVYNPYGKYVGQWRKIYVDDSLPLDECGRCLLPMTARFLELWPALLTKALIKVRPRKSLEKSAAVAVDGKQTGKTASEAKLKGKDDKKLQRVTKRVSKV